MCLLGKHQPLLQNDQEISQCRRHILSDDVKNAPDGDEASTRHVEPDDWDCVYGSDLFREAVGFRDMISGRAEAVFTGPL
jgi:hypothetical protein